jgi:hypothetical protein
MDGGMLAVDKAGAVSTAWRRGGLVYATTKDSSEEILLGRGEQPWVASTGAAPVAVWTGKREGELFATSLDHIEPRLIAPVARDPVIASSPSANGRPFVCWESRKGEQFTIEGMRLGTQ